MELTCLKKKVDFHFNSLLGRLSDWLLYNYQRLKYNLHTH